MSSKKLILILIVVTCIAYLSSLGNPFIWDDEQFITSNQYVQNFDIEKIFTTNTTAGGGVVSNYYRPLTTLSFAIDKTIWNQNPFGFHLTNLSLHIGAGVLLFLLLGEIGICDLGAFFISLFFLIFPSQTEAVSYINSRGDSLFTFFLFGSLLLFVLSLRGVLQSRMTSQSGLLRFARNDTLLLTGSLLLFILSIFSKETAIAAFPLFFVLIILKIVQKKESISQSMQKYAKPLFFASMSGVVVALYFTARLTILNFENTLNYYTGATFYSTHLLVRLFTFARVLWIYLGILIFPYPLHMERSVNVVSSLWNWEVWGLLGLVFSILYLIFWEIRRKHTGIILFGFALSACLLLPVSGIIPINGILYEHWLYVPIVGFWVMAYGVYQLLSSRAKSRDLTQRTLKTSLSEISPRTSFGRNDNKFQSNLRKFLISFAVVISILYIILTIRQNNIWADPITFYRYTLSFAPNSARLHNNLGMSLADAGDTRNAIPEYKKALALGSGYPQIYNNLGNAQMAVGDYINAEKNLKKALTLSPEFLVAKNNLIKLYLLSKQYNKALQESGNNPQVEQIIQQLKNGQ